ncbi:MAG: aspartate aminotransferase family protein [Bacteroidia bacterium]|nr:aspartate aminotransferase family protein [Bacteroidia bacterium]MDW8345789.1 aspartate aminotransferase family protein [Bacteroidia bacterium]
MPNIRELFYQYVAQTSPTPLALPVDKAEGIYIYDTQGKAYIDCISGISVSNIGHRHPKVLEAIEKQCTKYLHTMVYGEHIQSPQVELAALLCHHLPDTLNSVYFVNSGSEAVEGAIKLAKRYTSRKKIIAFHQSYHGSTLGSMSVNGSYTFKYRYEPLLPHVEFALLNSECCLKSIDKNTAAVLIEPIQAEAGIKIPSKMYLQQLRQKCNEVGALLIFDEIQTGFGRTGTLFYFEQVGIIPDILLTAKGMGGGMPIGAFIAEKKVMQTLAYEPILGHITTFGGHPVCCAASLATLQVITEEGFLSSVQSKGKYIEQRLERFTNILGYQGIGLLWSIELIDFDTVRKAVEKAMLHGLLIDWFLYAEHKLRFAPPLVITQQELSNALDILEYVLKTLE